MKTRNSIPAILMLLSFSLNAGGCASKPETTSAGSFQWSHNPSLVLPTDLMIELAAAGDFGTWESSRNDPQMGGQALPRDTSYRVVETRQWEVLGTSNGRPRDYSYTRIRTYSRDGR